ncbi:hypothetical protein PEL8287_00020 [Roseovarius litorisediminis]|uniref:Outer membrane protein beta-barrel domain-containing protein n=1 Tax=Roseovarius litorisediminis TaxID=1312363 RepID=A0A1Y5R5J1_9RHOB|nr:hypothetical protein [Roseovarius litorisediminis]SLN09540.1 hypothetical protein PEL8287_00020 [Roseovarius litorisediminis]
MKPRIPFAKASVNAVIAATLTLATSAAWAEETGWSYELAPYLWGSGISGTSSVVSALPPANVDASFSDILENLDAGAMFFGSATKDRFGIMGDLQYVSLSGAATGSGGLLSGSVENKLLILSLGGEWIASRTDTSEVRLIGGVRHWDTETNIALTVGPSGGTASGSDQWWDAMVGARGRYNLNEKSYLTGVALFGGGGSDFMADVFAGYGYRLSERTSLVGGFRYLSVDRNDGGFVYDVEQQGVLLGVNFTFN